MLEMILTVTIFSVALMVIAAAFNVGSKAWRKGLSQSKKEYRIYFALERLSDLISNGIYFTDSEDPAYSIYFEKMGFQGNANYLSFAVLAGESEINEGAFDKIEILKDQDDLVLKRISFLDLSSGVIAPGRRLILDIEDLVFEYGYIDIPEDGSVPELQWLDSWGGEDITGAPVAIRISIDYKSDKEEDVKIVKDVYIQSGIPAEPAP